MAQNSPAPTPKGPSVWENMASLPRFFRDVRAELNRITWPSGTDTRRMTVMVFVLVTIVALFLLLVDLTIGAGLSAVFGLSF
jgi:preprotein translocase subunit SecE